MDEVDALYARVQAAGISLFLDLEERWYGRGTDEAGVRQFVLADPDGYLLRFSQSLGTREVVKVPRPGDEAP